MAHSQPFKAQQTTTIKKEDILIFPSNYYKAPSTHVASNQINHISPGKETQSFKKKDHSQSTCSVCNMLPIYSISAVECSNCQKIFCYTCTKDIETCPACKKNNGKATFTEQLTKSNIEALNQIEVLCDVPNCE
jgi:hypothetical protein